MPAAFHKKGHTVEATVTSKGQITLPKELRKHLGIHTGSRVCFNIPANGSVELVPVLYDLEDLWRMADGGGPSDSRMTFEEMDAAKAKRQW